jgi:hypothetical protein
MEGTPTTKERIKLLILGTTQKKIEEFYIKFNDFKIIDNCTLINPIELNITENKEAFGRRENLISMCC